MTHSFIAGAAKMKTGVAVAGFRAGEWVRRRTGEGVKGKNVE